MTGREKIEAAFAPDGTPQIAAVICYEGIYLRDHWRHLTAAPWWHQQVPDLEVQMAWRREVIEKIGQDWFYLPRFFSRAERDSFAVEEREGGVFWVNRITGEALPLAEPRIGGWQGGGLHSVHPARLAESEEEIEALIPEPPAREPEKVREDGRGDLAERLLAEFGGELFPLVHVTSPLWRGYQLWGFEGMMTMIATRPELVMRVCERGLALERFAVREAAALGAAGVWIEECLTDLISPEAFARLNLPFLRELVEEIRAAGMHSLYYYCGDPKGKWNLLLEVGADALSLEESKKGFVIDLEEVVEKVQGRCAVLGNLDAIGLLERGSEAELRAEIARQIAAGRRNRSRFVMSLGSPVTPGTSVARVRQYCEWVHELGSR